MLENKCPTCGRNLGSGYKCPVCSVYVPPKQDMKKPTKEQIEQVFNNVFTWVEHKTIRVNFLELIEKIITEWEKIKDLDARVEKMCKNNPGIKDFEDFNEAINSPK